jgi:predicted ATP-grasp superfamily ATP-dependent carboligase
MPVAADEATMAPAARDRFGHVPGAVVLGGDYQGLGIVRSLGRQNVPVCVIDDERSIARFSRYVTKVAVVDSLREEEQIVGSLLEIGRRFDLEGWVLYPTRDEIVAAFARQQSVLAKHFRVPTPGWETTKWVWDKRNTYALADKLGIPTPGTWYPRAVEDLEQIQTASPWVIKPAIKEHFFYATKSKAWRANNRNELGEFFRRASVNMPIGEVMIQDLIPGGGSQQFAYCAFFKEGRALASMVVRRCRQHPLEFGRASTFVETIELPLLEELSERFLRAIDYYGLVEMEYKLDPRDGRYKLLDVNGRTWGYHTVGSRAGVDFPYLLYADQMGQSVQHCRGLVGVKWIRLVTDLPTGILEIARGDRGVLNYIKSLASVNVEAVFSRKDPLPGLMELILLPYLWVRRGF